MNPRRDSLVGCGAMAIFFGLILVSMPLGIGFAIGLLLGIIFRRLSGDFSKPRNQRITEVS